MRFIWLLFLIIPNAYSLESVDVLNTQILKAYNRNILVLNRGLEDAIYKGDHIMLSSSDGFIARGICVKTSMLTSHWKIYRVVRPELVSKDSIYKLHSINQSEIPKDLAKFRKVDFTPYFNSYGDKDRLAQLKLQNERIAYYDLPKKVEDTDLYDRSTRTGFDRFIEENFHEEDLKRDLSNTYFDIFVSPYTFESLYNQKQSHYGARLYNNGEKYRFDILAIERQRRIVDPLNKQNSYNNKSTHYSLNFQINRISKNWSLISSAKYDREKFGQVYYPHKFVRAAPLGFKYHIYEDDPKDEFFEISYAPAFDIIEYNDLSSSFGDSLRERIGYRHTFQAKLHTNFSERLQYQMQMYYAPFTENIIGEVDWGDSMFDFDQTLSYDIGNSFFWDFSLRYTRDELRADTYNIRADNSISTVRLRYEFAL